MRLLQALALISFALLGGFSFARADDYPSRPITLIVPFPPGGSTTVMARNVADKMSAALGQQIVVENRGGAGGTIGTRFVAKAAPDGYTILLSYTATMAIAPTMNVNMLQHPATQANLQTLARRGHVIVEPGSGYLACGMTGPGRLAEPEAIAEAVDRAGAAGRWPR